MQQGANPALLIRDPKLIAARRGHRRLAGSDDGAAVHCASPRRWRGTAGFSLDTPFERADAGAAARRPARHRRRVDRAGRRPPRRRRRRAEPPTADRPLPVQGPVPRHRRGVARQLRLSPAAGPPGQRGRPAPPATARGCATTPRPCRFQGRTHRRTVRPAAGGESLALLQGPEADEGRSSRWPANCCARSRNRLQFLVDVGLDYLTLGRPAPTLSGGESQRIRLASQIGSGLTGVLYVLDEPTIGLHPRDNRRLLAALQHLRDLGNTLVLVEHDREVIAAADYLLDFGPGAGDRGGEITARGTPKQVLRRRRRRSPDSICRARRRSRCRRIAACRVRASASRNDDRVTLRRSAADRQRRPAEQPQEHRRRLPARRVRRRHRRQRLRQEFAGPRDAVQHAGPQAAPRHAPPAPPTTTSSAWSRSTRSSTSIRTRSATRRRPTRRPTPASST